MTYNRGRISVYLHFLKFANCNDFFLTQGNRPEGYRFTSKDRISFVPACNVFRPLNYSFRVKKKKKRFFIEFFIWIFTRYRNPNLLGRHMAPCKQPVANQVVWRNALLLARFLNIFKSCLRPMKMLSHHTDTLYSFLLFFFFFFPNIVCCSSANVIDQNETLRRSSSNNWNRNNIKIIT